MTQWMRTWRMGVITCGIVVGSSGVASGQAIAEFLFWDSMGKAAGSAVRNHAEYRAQRELWARKIVEARSALERCGNCSDRARLEKELAYWQQTERQFQEVAGAAAAAVGMPPNVAKWLGINVPMAPPPSREEWVRRNEVIRPAWIDERPPFCRQASDAHLQCLRDHQARTGILPTDVAKQPGGACYDTSKFFLHCFREDYEAFEREKALQAARASGKIIPEYVESGAALRQVYYGQVRDDFVPTLPPDVVRAALAEGATGIRLSSRKSGAGVVGTVMIEPFHWTNVVPSSTCFEAERRRGEIENRVCDDLSMLSFKDRSPLLACQYTGPGGASSRGAVVRFWLDRRPTLADPKRLLSRSANHPVLTVGEPRASCPATERQAQQAHASWTAAIARLRAATPQLDPSVAVPESAWLKETREAAEAEYEASVARGAATKSFPFEGTYSFETTLGDGTRLSGDCVISSTNVAIFYVLRCRHPSGDMASRAHLFGDALMADWRIGGARTLLRYQVDDASADRLVGGATDNPKASGQLVRTGDLIPLADFPVTGTYRFDVSGELGASSGSCTISTEERYRPPAFRFECVTDAGQSFSNTARHTENAILVSWTSVGGLALHGLVFVVDQQSGAASGRTLVGGNDSGAVVRLTRTGDAPPSKRRAP